MITKAIEGMELQEKMNELKEQKETVKKIVLDQLNRIDDDLEVRYVNYTDTSIKLRLKWKGHEEMDVKLLCSVKTVLGLELAKLYPFGTGAIDLTFSN